MTTKPHFTYMPDRRGQANGHSKLKDADIVEIRRLRALAPPGRRLRRTDPRSTTNLAFRFGVQQAEISKIASGQRWAHII